MYNMIKLFNKFHFCFYVDHKCTDSSRGGSDRCRALRVTMLLPSGKQCYCYSCVKYFIVLMHRTQILLSIVLNIFNIESILKTVFAVASCKINILILLLFPRR